MGELGGEPEGVSYTIREVTADSSAAFTVLNEICCVSEFVFLQFTKKTFLYQISGSFPGHKGLCDRSMQDISFVLFVFILSTHVHVDYSMF